MRTGSVFREGVKSTTQLEGINVCCKGDIGYYLRMVPEWPGDGTGQSVTCVIGIEKMEGNKGISNVRIGVLGSGHVGAALGGKWAKVGHEVIFGVRCPQEKRRRDDLGLSRFNARYATVADAICDADVILFAIPSAAVAGVIDGHGSNLDGKILIDPTNDFHSDQMSKVHELVLAAPSAKVYRAFNSLGRENFEDPVFGGESADLFYCGPDAGDCLAIIEALIREIGLRPIRIGDLDQVPIVDSVLRLWFSLAKGQGFGRHMAFKTLGI